MSINPMFHEFIHGEYAGCNNFYVSSIIYKVEYKGMVFIENILFSEWSDRIDDYYIEHNEFGRSPILSEHYEEYFTNSPDICSRDDDCKCDRCVNKHFKITQLKSFLKAMTDIYAMKKLIKYQQRHNSVNKSVIVVNKDFSYCNLNRILKREKEVMYPELDDEELYVDSDSESM